MVTDEGVGSSTTKQQQQHPYYYSITSSKAIFGEWILMIHNNNNKQESNNNKMLTELSCNFFQTLTSNKSNNKSNNSHYYYYYYHLALLIQQLKECLLHDNQFVRIGALELLKGALLGLGDVLLMETLLLSRTTNDAGVDDVSIRSTTDLMMTSEEAADDESIYESALTDIIIDCANNKDLSESTISGNHSAGVKAKQVLTLIQSFILENCAADEANVLQASFELFTTFVKSNLTLSDASKLPFDNSDILVAELISNILAVSGKLVQNANIGIHVRSVRSAAFDIFSLALSYTSQHCSYLKTSIKLSNEIQKDLKSFVRALCEALEGEKDPRVLLVGLQVLEKCLDSLASSSSLGVHNISTYDVIFETVSVYYPIVFTPPKNDPYKIRPEELSGALWNILSNVNIVEMSLGLFIDRLISDDEDGELDVQEKKESLHDLEKLILNETNIARFSPHLFANLSDALVQVHESSCIKDLPYADYVLQIKRHLDPIDKSVDSLPEACVSFAARVCKFLELQTNTSSRHAIQDEFTSAAIRKLAPYIADPENFRGRSAVHYLSGIASTSSKLYRAVVNAVVPDLISIIKGALLKNESLQTNKQVDSERISAACISYGVLMGSYKSLDTDIVVYHPDPINEFTNVGCQSLLSLFNIAHSILENGYNSQWEKVSIGISNAFFSLFKVDLLSSKCLHQLISTQNKCLFGDNHNKTTPSESSANSYMLVTAYLFSILLSSSNSSTMTTIGRDDDCHDVQVLREKVINILIESVMDPWAKLNASSFSGSDFQRANHIPYIVLINVCKLNAHVAKVILDRVLAFLESCLQTEKAALSQGNGNVIQLEKLRESTLLAASVCSKLVVSGGVNTKSVWQQSSVPCQIFSLLTESFDQREFVSVVTDSLVPFYSKCCHGQVLMFFKSICSFIPPLSDSDHRKLCAILPLFAATMSEMINMFGHTELSQELVRSVITFMNIYMDNSILNSARDAAGTCIFITLSCCDRSISKEEKTIPSIMNNVMIPTISSVFIDGTANNVDGELKIDMKGICRGLSLIGSAAIARGGKSAKVGDSIFIFLVELLLHGKSSISSSIDTVTVIIDPNSNEEEQSILRSIGSILTANPTGLWIQRLCTKAISHLKIQDGIARDIIPTQNAVGVATYILCSSSRKAISSSTTMDLFQMIFNGVHSYYTFDSFQEILPLSLGAILKILSNIDTTTNNIKISVVQEDIILPFCLEICSMKRRSSAAIKSKLLAMQLLVLIMKIRPDIIQKCRANVIGALGLIINQEKDKAVMHMCVEVRNRWYLHNNIGKSTNV